MDNVWGEHWQRILDRIRRRSPPIAATLARADRVEFKGDRVRIFIPDEFADRVPMVKSPARMKVINEVLAAAVAPGTTLEIIVGTEVPDEPDEPEQPAKPAKKAKKTRARKRDDGDKSQRLGLPGFIAEDARYRLGNEGEQIPDPW